MEKSHSPYCRLKNVELGAVRWTDGFWAEKIDLCKNATIPSIRRAMDIPENSAVFGNFSVAAGLESGEHRGTFWVDGDCYQSL